MITIIGVIISMLVVSIVVLVVLKVIVAIFITPAAKVSLFVHQHIKRK